MAGEKVERADVVRNRAKILEAAPVVFSAKPAAAITMDDLARAAGIGRATLYRHFPTVADVAEAILDEQERAIQQRLLSGTGAFAPSRPPRERLRALYRELLALLDMHATLVLGSEVGRSRFATGAYRVWHTYVRSLLAEAGAPRPATMADLLLAPLGADVYLHASERPRGRQDLGQALLDLADAVLVEH